MGISTKKRRPKKRAGAGHRLLDADTLLRRTTGATLAEMITELEIGRRTAGRYLAELKSRGTPLEVIGERDRAKVHRIVPQATAPVGTFTSEEVIGQKLMEGLASGFEGTGIDESVQRARTKMAATLKPKDRARTLDLSKKILHVPDHAHDYSDKSEILDQIVSALVEEQRLVIVHQTKTRERRRFRIEPYTLVTHKRALYVLGYSHYHKSLRTFALDGIVDATRLRDETFVYPKDHDPKEIFEGAFGLIVGEETEVTIRFHESVEGSVIRRKWHPTQSFKKKGGYLYLTMRPRGTTEVIPWVLSWGSKAAIVSPPSLREEWRRHADEMARMARELAADDERRLGSDAEGDETTD